MLIFWAIAFVVLGAAVLILSETSERMTSLAPTDFERWGDVAAKLQDR